MGKLADAFKKGIAKVKSANPIAVGKDVGAAVKSKWAAKKLMDRARSKQNPDAAFPMRVQETLGSPSVRRWGLYGDEGHGDLSGEPNGVPESDIAPKAQRAALGKPDASAPDAGPYDRAKRATSSK